MKRVAILSAVVLAGCTMPLALDRPALQFDVQALQHGQWLEEPEVTVSGGTGVISIETVMSTPDPCRTFEADAARHGSELVLQVVVRREGDVCPGVIGTFAYSAQLAGMEPGVYLVTVTHAFPGTGWEGPRTVYHAPVQVD